MGYVSEDRVGASKRLFESRVPVRALNAVNKAFVILGIRFDDIFEGLWLANVY